MNSNDLLNRMLDYDAYIESLLNGIHIEENQSAPPMYNILQTMHTCLRTNINQFIEESRLITQNEDALPISEFHLKIHSMRAKEEKECSICLDVIEKGSVCSMLPCVHTFHEKCIKTWLTMNKSTCPECRNQI